MNVPQPYISPSPDAEPFWSGCRRHRLMLPFCTVCEKFFFYPRTACPACGSRSIEWREASGRGRLYTFCIQYHTSVAEFRDAVPFVTAIVELDEGPRMMSLLTGVEPDPGAAISCDMPLVVDFVDYDDGTVLPVFRPA